MSISLYDAAKKIKKDGTTYFLLKSGSKNCFTYGGQRIIDNDLRDKWTRGETRESDWSVIAKTTRNIPLAVAHWNAPVSHLYGRIQFGNGYNVALYLDRKEATPYEQLDEQQQRNFDQLLAHAETVEEKWLDSMIDLDKYPDLPENKLYKTEHTYCGREMYVNGNHTTYQGRIYWKETTL